jgi:hypothetical protein
MPLARKEGLERQKAAGEILVYDLERNRAHCLNRTASLVWNHCDGKSTLEETARALEKELHIESGEEIVIFVLSQLRRAHLLQKPYGSLAATWQTRRDFMKKLKRLGISASMVLPLVTSIVAPSPAYALSCVPANGCGPAPNCVRCNPPNCNGLCCGNFCVSPFLARIFCGC